MCGIIGYVGKKRRLLICLRAEGIGIPVPDGQEVLREIPALLDKIRQVLKQSERIKEIALKYVDASAMLLSGLPAR